jgi:hypothetical protein
VSVVGFMVELLGGWCDGREMELPHLVDAINVPRLTDIGARVEAGDAMDPTIGYDVYRRATRPRADGYWVYTLA